MKRSQLATLLSAVLLGLITLMYPRASSDTPSLTSEEGLITLYTFDDLRSTFSLEHGQYGRVVQNGEYRNRMGQISYDREGDSEITVAIAGGQEGCIKDLGDIRTGAGSSLFHSIVLRDGLVQLRANKYASSATIPEKWLELPSTSRVLDSAPVKLGHVYLIRIASNGRDLYSAIRVVQHTPGVSVTLSWRRVE